MIGNGLKDTSRFYVIGINYKKSDAAVRGKFAINQEQYANILKLAPTFGVYEFFILSTCNRTEVYGFSEDVQTFISLLCTQTEGDAATFSTLSYIKNGTEAIEHFFSVGAGLDSQILGDYEIVGQIKSAVKFSKDHGFISTFIERLTNSILQASKIIKNQTALSEGTVSVSFAAVQYIKEKVSNISEKRILLIGTGKIGRNTTKNLIDYLGTRSITLINRTEEKAIQLAKDLALQYGTLDNLLTHIAKADIIIVSTNAASPTILHQHVAGLNKKLIIDLSIPYSVESSVKHLSNITLVNVDELSRLKDETFKKRLKEVPKVQAIIKDHIQEFWEWLNMRKHVPALKAVKTKLSQITNCPFYLQLSLKEPNLPPKEKIQHVIDGMATKMRKQQHQPGCYYIEAINEYISISSN